MEEIFNILQEFDDTKVNVTFSTIEAISVIAAIRTLQDNSERLSKNKALSAAKNKIKKSLEFNKNAKK